MLYCAMQSQISYESVQKIRLTSRYIVKTSLLPYISSTHALFCTKKDNLVVCILYPSSNNRGTTSSSLFCYKGYEGSFATCIGYNYALKFFRDNCQGSYRCHKKSAYQNSSFQSSRHNIPREENTILNLSVGFLHTRYYICQFASSEFRNQFARSIHSYTFSDLFFSECIYYLKFLLLNLLYVVCPKKKQTVQLMFPFPCYLKQQSNKVLTCIPAGREPHSQRLASRHRFINIIKK